MKRTTFWVLFMLGLACTDITVQADLLKEAKDFIWVCTDGGTGGYEAFPDVCKLANGKLMTVFYAGYSHISRPNELWPSGGRIGYCLSEDQGRTWSQAQPLCDTPMDDRDPSLSRLRSGRLLCNFFTYPDGHTWLTDSDDEGETWTPPRQIVTSHVASSPLRELSNGRLILPLYCAVVISDDQGSTWSDIIPIDPAGQHLTETDVIELRDHTLYAVHRADGDVPMHYTLSNDYGSTWGPTRSLPFYGNCAYLHRAPDDSILLGYREYLPETKKYNTVLRYSQDEGKTWSEAVLVDALLGGQPSIVTLEDDSILIVYYEEGVGSNIRARRFRLEKDGINWLPWEQDHLAGEPEAKKDNTHEPFSFTYVCRDGQAGAYEAFPDLCRVDDKLYCVFYAGYQHVSYPNEDWPRGAHISYCVSQDEGRTWGEPQIVWDSPVDDRDPSLSRLSKGRLFCNYFTYPEGATWLTHSDDEGKTWSEPQKIVEYNVASSPIRELSSGRLLLPLYCAVVISDDRGQTWSKIIPIDNAAQQLSETDVIELKSGILYAVHRADGGPPMYFTTSRDQGTTWGKTHPLPYRGHSPYLHRTVDDLIVLSYRDEIITDEKSSWATRMIFSPDECHTWSEPVLIDTVTGAYPSMINLKDGSVLVVYYEEGTGSDIRARKFRITDAQVQWLPLE